MAILHQEPTPRPGRRVALVAATVLALGVGLTWLVRPGSPLPARTVVHAPPAEATARAAADASCDAACAVAGVISPATTACAASIEELASFGVRWLDAEAGRVKFDRVVWLQQARGTVTLAGGHAEFRNAAGDSLPVDYECDFDPARRAVLDARVRPRAAATATAATATLAER